jgi:phosphonoacetaldehyde hydrolase
MTNPWKSWYRGPLQAVVFDWAGTTVDYGCIAPALVFVEAFRTQRVHLTMDEVRGPMGREKRAHIQALVDMPQVAERWRTVHGVLPGKLDVEQLFRMFTPVLMDLLPRHSVVIPGIPEVVAQLRQRGLKIGSCTGYSREMMDRVEPIARMQGYHPDVIVCPEMVGGGRPAAWMLWENLRQLGVPCAAAAVKVGDTVADIEEGRNAGAWTVAVLNSSSDLGLSLDEFRAADPVVLADRCHVVREGFLEAGAHVVIDDMGDLPQALDSIEEWIKEGRCP